MTDMQHMKYLGMVLTSDEAVLREKEATYRGSWKLAGGRSAWFMVRRNMDRMIQILAPPAPPPEYDLEDVVCGVQNALGKSVGSVSVHECTVRGVEHMRDMIRAEDIFAKIEEHPGGEDGTALACMRDLRRYLLLVEAEMMARGVVEATTTGEMSSAATPEKVLLTREISPDFDAVISDEKVYERGRTPRPATERDRVRATGHVDCVGNPLIVGDPCTWVTNTSGTREVWLVRVTSENRPEVKDDSPGTMLAKWKELRLDPTRSSRAFTMKHATERDKANATWVHINGLVDYGLAPHVVGAGYAVRKGIEQDLFAEFWNRRGDIYILESHVLSSRIPHTLRDHYNSRGESWTLRPEKIPPGAREFFPCLGRDRNMKEHEELPDWQQVLYTWNETKVKYELAEENAAWAMEDES